MANERSVNKETFETSFLKSNVFQMFLTIKLYIFVCVIILHISRKEIWPRGECRISVTRHLSSPLICFQMLLQHHLSAYFSTYTMASLCQIAPGSVTSPCKRTPLHLGTLLFCSRVSPHSTHPNLHTLSA